MTETTPAESAKHPAPDTANPSASEPADSPAAAIVGGGDGASIDPSDERDLWVGRTHWKHFAPSLGLWAGGLILMIVLLFWVSGWWPWLTGGKAVITFLIVMLATGIVVVGRMILAVVGCRYRLTSQRLFITRGILSQTVDQTELIRVDDVRVCKSMMDRIFGLGTVEIISTDATDREITMTGIAAPDHVVDLVRTNMRTLRKRSLFVENL